MNLYQVAEEIARRLANIFLEGRARPASGLRRDREVPGRPALARLRPVLRVLPRRQRGRPGRQPPDRLDGDHRPHHAPVCHQHGGTGARTRQACREYRNRYGGRIGNATCRCTDFVKTCMDFEANSCPLRNRWTSSPFWTLPLITVAVMLVALEAGYRLGRRRSERSEHEKESLVGAAVAATLALASSMLAFTFGIAGSRF